jgi:sulfur carrier protein ThiS
MKKLQTGPAENPTLNPTLTVAELIEHLKGMPPDAPVALSWEGQALPTEADNIKCATKFNEFCFVREFPEPTCVIFC